MSNSAPYRIRSIIDYHRITGFPQPLHPLVSVINIENLDPPPMDNPINVTFDFYTVSIKRNLRITYGRQSCDFDEGVLFFTSPGQVIGVGGDKPNHSAATGWMILFHPELLFNTSLAQKIKHYHYFDYSVHEPLFLSESEERAITELAKSIAQEYHANIDRFSRNIIVAHLELLMTYADRFYQRQFLTREVSSHDVLSRMETLLAEYFNNDEQKHQGLPTVTYLAEQLHLSPGYLSDLSKTVTGRTAQQHIHDKLIEKAKEKLATTRLTISEIAYDLGFEHLQSFSRLFKAKTDLSPVAFRQSFN